MNAMTEWADDAGSSYWIDVQCTADEDECDWYGRVRAIDQHGTTSWEFDDCPECGSAISERVE